MAKQPEHDFAPSWLKIPHNSQIPHHHSEDHHRLPGKHPFHQDSRPRRPPLHNGYHGYPPGPFSRGGGGPNRNDERRHYPNRQHSADDLMSMGGDGRLPFNRNSSGMFSPPPHSFTEAFFPNANQYRGRFGPGTQEGYNGRVQTRSRHHSGGRQRYPSGGSTGSKDRTSHSEPRKEGFYPRTSHSEDRSKTADERSGMRLKKEPATGGGDRGKDVGGEKDSSALSSHDFPSLSGDKDQKKDNTKPLKPAGAWDNRPGTTKVTKVAGRNYKLIQKTTLKDTTAGSKDSGAPTFSSPKGLSPRSNSGSALPAGSLKLSSQISTGPPSQVPTRGIIPVKSTNGGLMLKVTTSTKVTPRKQSTKDSPNGKEKLAPALKEKLTKDKPAVVPSSNGNSNNTAPSIVTPPVIKPNVSQPIDVPSSRGIPSRVKKGQKNAFIRELRRSSTTDVQTNGGGLDNEDYNSNRASRMNGDMEKNVKNLHDMSINSVEITTSLENGYLDANESWEDTSTSTVKLSSSQEAEQRLLREMGWHEHSDNEEGYAPITEDERQEFKLRSQQLKRNGFPRPELIISTSLPINTLPPPIIDEDNFSCASLSDTSDDEDY